MITFHHPFILVWLRKKRPKLSVQLYGSGSHKLFFSILTDKLACLRLKATESLILEDMVGSHFLLLIGIPPPTISDLYQRRRSRGGRQGQLGLGLVKNYNDRHRGWCKNDYLQESGKKTLHGDHGGGVFGTTVMKTSMTIIGGSTNHQRLSWMHPSWEAMKAAKEEEVGMESTTIKWNHIIGGG